MTRTRTRTKAAPLRMALVVVLVVLLRTATTIIQVADAASTSSSSSSNNNNNNNKNHYLHGQQPREKQGVAGCWNHVNAAAPDAILGIAQAFRDCTDPRKVNICVGAYRNDDGQPWILPSVQRAEELLLQQQQHQQQGAAAPAARSSSFDKARMETKEYLPIEGDVEFLECALQFAYGEELYRHLVTATTNRIASVQTLSGTGACSVGGYFLARFMQGRRQQQRQQTPKEQEKDQLRPRIYLPTPTWSNHWNVFRQCGLEPFPYRYYNSKTNDLDFEGLLEDLNAAPMGSAVLLHACAHNPTGCDPNLSQWKQIAKVMQQRRLVAFFDSAYQGFVSGNANQDAEAFRYFVSNYGTWDDATSKKRAWLRRLGRFRGLSNPSVTTTTTTTIPILLAQSFAKNFGLYGERCGTLSILCQTTSERDCVLSQLRSIIRPLYSSPPRHGSSIVKTILRNETLKEQYKTDCATMAHRIQTMRQALVALLQELQQQAATSSLSSSSSSSSTAPPLLDWSHMDKYHQKGMFAYTSYLTPERCDALTRDHAIYLTRNGRLSLAGLNENNLPYVAKAIHQVTTTIGDALDQDDEDKSVVEKKQEDDEVDME